MNILLSAYVDQNLGDDLFIDSIASRYPDHEIYLLCDSELVLNVQLTNHKNLKRLGYKQALKVVRRMDALLIVGGSIFQDNPQYYKYDYMRNILVTWYKIMGRRIFVMGSNVGPVYSFLGRLIVQYCIMLASHISVRDVSSLRLLQSWGVRRRLSYSPDMIFSYDCSPLQKCIDNRSIGLGISVIHHGSDKSKMEAYISKLAQVIDEYLRRSDLQKRVALFAFDGGLENDGVIVDAVVKAVAGDVTRIDCHYYGEEVLIADFMKKFLACEYLVCSRFHAVVLALKSGIPFFPIAYASKTLNLLADIGFDRPYVEYGNMEKMDSVAVVADAIAQKNAFVLPPGYVEKSSGHFFALDAFLAKA